MNGYIALVLREEGGVYRAIFPDLEGCHAVGTNVDDALANARGALKSYAAERARSGIVMPPPRPASDVAPLSSERGAVAGACIHLRDISVIMRMSRGRSGRTRKAE
jgi:predicted RNase H-like HicB family nuclease